MSNNSSELEANLLISMASIISSYSLFEDKQTIYVALSGGKDSITACLLLKKLGYNVEALVIDTGDALFNSQFIKNVCDGTGIKVQIIYSREPRFLSLLTEDTRNRVVESIRTLDNLARGEINCTSCYYIKIILLCNYIKSEGGNSIVFAHHQTDMIISLLKCYWTDVYFRELTLPLGIAYNPQQMKLLMNTNQLDLNYLHQMVNGGLAATDEPIVEYPFQDGFRIVRPMAGLDENDIIKYIQIRGVQVAADFCSFKELVKPFRSLVYEDYLKRLEKLPSLGTVLNNLVQMGLNEDGTLRFRPRNIRGDRYPGFKPFIRKI